jgi:hypothetical protein
MSRKVIAVVAVAAAGVLLFSAAVVAKPNGEGMISSDSPFYGLDKGFEQVDEALSLSPESQMGKAIAHLDERIAEAKAAVERGSAEGIEKASKAIEDKAGDIADDVQDVDDIRVLIDAISGLALAEQTIQGLLADPDMPEESAIGLETALGAIQSSMAIAQQYLDSVPVEIPPAGAGF